MQFKEAIVGEVLDKYITSHNSNVWNKEAVASLQSKYMEVRENHPQVSNASEGGIDIYTLIYIYTYIIKIDLLLLLVSIIWIVSAVGIESFEVLID